MNKLRISVIIIVTVGITALTIGGWQLVSGESDPCNDGRMKEYFGNEHQSSRRLSPGVWACVNRRGWTTQVEVMSDGAIHYRPLGY